MLPYTDVTGRTWTYGYWYVVPPCSASTSVNQVVSTTRYHQVHQIRTSQYQLIHCLIRTS